jgi:hypothetical protein
MGQTQLAFCPHCQSEEGYYFKTQIKGTCESRFKFDGSILDTENSDMHDCLSYTFSKVLLPKS